MQITPTSYSPKIIEISNDEEELNTLIGYGKETLKIIPKDEKNYEFIFKDLASVFFSEIQKRKHFIICMSRKNPNLFITLTYKVGFIAKKLSELSSTNTAHVSLNLWLTNRSMAFQCRVRSRQRS